MVDVSKRLSVSPKVQPKSQLAKKWMSEPNLLNDDEDDRTWIKEDDNMEEEGISFTEDLPEPSRLVHINKQRVQLRPQRRPPSRDFVKSRASMDFDFALSEEIKEEDESGQYEATEDHEKHDMHIPVKQTSPGRPRVGSGWKLPTPGSEVVLRKTKPIEPENSDGKNEIRSDEFVVPENNSPDTTPESSPEKKHKERKRFKVHLFKFRRSRKGKQDGRMANKETEMKTNLTATYAVSVDSGTRPLGEASRQRLPRNRRSRKSDEKGLNWLLGLFHKRNAAESTDDAPKSGEVYPKITVTEEGSNLNGKSEVNGTIPELKIQGELTKGHRTNEANDNLNSRSYVKQKYGRTSAAF